MRSILIALAISGILTVPAFAGEQTRGELTLCKTKTDSLPMDLKFPAGLVIEDIGPIGESLNDAMSCGRVNCHAWPLTVLTIERVEILPGKRCASVPAAISPTSQKTSVSPSDHRKLMLDPIILPGQNLKSLLLTDQPGIGAEFMNMEVTVSKSFK